MPKSLAEIVLEEGLATATAIGQAAEAADAGNFPLVVALVRQLGIAEVALVAALRRHVRVATADPATTAPEPDAMRELSRDVCRRRRVVPLSVSSYGGGGRVLRLAMADPTDAVAVAEVEHVTSCRVEPVLMTLSAVEELVEKTYRALVTEVMKRPSGGREDGVAGATLRAGPPAPEVTPATPRARPESEDAIGPTTVPYHRLSDEADLDVRLTAVVQLLVAKGVITEDELEDQVRQLMRGHDEDP